MRLAPSLCCLALWAAGAQAQAGDYTLGGQISHDTDVAVVDFSLLGTGTYVGVWTDSFRNGTNFDPYIAVWSKTGTDYQLVFANDDNPDIGATQTAYDSGVQFTSLAAGSYRVTISLSGNTPLGGLLSQGFALTGTTPTTLSSGGDWQLHVTNVDTAQAVPEPQSWALLMAGLGALAVVGRRQRHTRA